LTYRIRDSHGERNLTEKDFPIILGSTASAGIPVTGLNKNVEAAVIKLADVHPHIQPVLSEVPIFHNGKKLEKEVQLDHGDVIGIGHSEIIVRQTEHDYIFQVSESEHASQDVLPQPVHSSDPVEIEPISFHSRQQSRKLKQVPIIRWSAGLFLATVLVLFAFSAWFVFTARQVIISIEPDPEEISFSGGSIFTPRFGNYYLMQPGEYRLVAHKKCFSPLEHVFPVNGEKQQNVQLQMQKLPGRLLVRAHQSGSAERHIIDAPVYIDGTEVGHTPVENLEVLPGLRTLEIRAENYQDFLTDIDVEGCSTLQEFHMALLPGWSAVTISSIPGGAHVEVDGKSVGNTPVRIQLAAGTYMLEISADLHNPWKQELIVTPNEPQEIHDIQLHPADGSLAVSTTPSGANVIIGEKFVGQTPLKTGLSPDKEHVIQVSKAGYEKASRTVRVPSSGSQQISIELKPRKGIIDLSVEPAGTELLVNGKSSGTAPKQLRLVAVKQTLEFRKEGYRPYRTSITPRPGFPQQLQVVLKSKSIPVEAASAVITTKGGYRLKLISASPFTMGSSRREQGRRSNETLRKIKLERPFYMGLREVTNKEFRAFMVGHNSGTMKGKKLNSHEQPVVRVTWELAALFCNWLSAQESLPPAYVKKAGKMDAVTPITIGYRLPTEAEWEYAARFSAGHTFMKYPWGQKFPPVTLSGNYSDQSAKGLLPSVVEGYNDGYAVSAPPAQFKPNELGLYDLGGNVAEWCHDYYTIYSYSPEKTYVDPIGPADGKHHVIRGSSWKHGSISTLRLAYRGYSDDKRDDVGFRVSRYLK
jgi:formylglycine-generating enzyme required for sulfatase activity